MFDIVRTIKCIYLDLNFVYEKYQVKVIIIIINILYNANIF
jgi:hypothetical protein